MSLEEYILLELKRQKISVTEFAEKRLKITRQAFYNLIKQSNPDLAIIKKIETELEVDLSNLSGTTVNTVSEPSVSYDSLGVPVYNIEFSVGTVRRLLEARGDAHIIGRLDIPELKGCDAVVKARGNSMADRINDKDWIGIRRLINWREFLPPGYIYAIITDELEIVKYIRKGSSADVFLISSHNSEEYEPFELPINLIREIWAVRAIIPASKIETII